MKGFAMAEATETTTVPKRRGRKPGTGKTAAPKSKTAATTKATPTAAPRKTAASAMKAPARKRSAKKVQDGSFTESIELARAAVNSATAAAKVRVKSAKEGAKATASSARSRAKGAADTVSSFDWKEQRDQVVGQATKTAREAANTAKARTGSAMQSLAKLIGDTAQTVDTKLGPQYGDYTRQAANAVAGAAKSLDEKDIDQLMGEARDFVRKSPAVAIGAAAIAGYVLMRLARGSDES
ncbi:MAG: hypothetical protein AB7U35_15915 [Sphingobium sp.]